MFTFAYLRTMPPLLVGRDRELGLLHDYLTAACAGQGSLVLIGGEAGIGKTALAEVVCAGAAAQGALILTGRCFDLAETPAYGTWLSLFERYHPDPHLPPHPPVFAEPGIVGTVASQATLFRQVLDFLISLAAVHPVILFLDDLHWSDPASLELLRSLARSLDTLPLLVLATYRSDDLTHLHPLPHLLPVLVREAHAARVDLHPLDDVAVYALVTARYNLMEDDTRRLVAYVQGRAEGNPFYLSELLRSLEETGVLRWEGECWALGDPTRAAVPPLLRQVIEDRVAHLDAESQRLLARAAVIGQEVPLALWTAVSDADEETILTAIEEGTRARLLVEMPDGARVQFDHALVREAIYEGIPATQRRRLHRRVGEALLIGRQPDPNAMAYHFQCAADERAVEWLLRAWRQASRAYAWETAAARGHAALALMEEEDADMQERAFVQLNCAELHRYTAPQESIALFEKAERLAVLASDRAVVCCARSGRGLLRCLLGDMAQGLAEMIVAAEQQESLTPEERAPRRLRGLPSMEWITNDRGTVLLWLAHVGRYREVLTMAERFFAHSAPQPAIRGGSTYGDGLLGLGNAYMALGYVAEARDALRRAREAYAAVEHQTLVAQAAADELRLILAFAADALAERRQIAAIATEALGRASGAVGDIPGRLAGTALLSVEGRWAEARALVEHRGFSAVRFGRTEVAGWLAYWQGDVVRAWECIRAILPDGIATEPGTCTFSRALGVQRIAVHLSLDAGDLPQARAWLEAQKAWLDWSGAVLGVSEGNALWAQYYRQVGEAKKALEHAECALAHASEPRQPLALIAAHRILGELHTYAGSFDEATTHFASSLQLADACAAPYERALTLLAHTELLAATGDHAGAIALLNEIRAICTPLGAWPALARVDALAARLAPSSSSIYPAGLSAREVEVLRLLVQGLSNRAIAARLFISVRTVERHVRNLYTKIDAHNRADATAFAFRHDIG